jgi:hypothetical protein
VYPDAGFGLSFAAMVIHLSNWKILKHKSQSELRRHTYWRFIMQISIPLIQYNTDDSSSVLKYTEDMIVINNKEFTKRLYGAFLGASSVEGQSGQFWATLLLLLSPIGE